MTSSISNSIVSAFVVSVLFLCACSHDQAWSVTSRELHKLAGTGAIDCGSIRLGTDKTAALNCAQDAADNEKAYTLAYEVPGRDSQLILAVAHTVDDQYFVLKYDSAGWDPNSLKARDQLLGKLLVRSCIAPPSIDANSVSCK